MTALLTSIKDNTARSAEASDAANSTGNPYSKIPQAKTTFPNGTNKPVDTGRDIMKDLVGIR